MANSLHTASIFFLLFFLPKAEQTVFLSAENANKIIQRHRRANFLMEELLKGNLEKECYEELCSYEEARETFEDKVKTDHFWKGYYCGRQCSSNPCMNNGVCRDTIRSYNCTCGEGYNGEKCQFAVNECHIDAEDGCQHFCEPGYGHGVYTCSCATGYRLGEDEKSCHPTDPYACGQLPKEENFKESGPQDNRIPIFPWQVLLLNAEEIQQCSGVIINQFLILTTAKCTENHKPSFVIVGSDDPENRQKIKVESYQVHSKYSMDTGDNNIALVKLQDRITFCKYALPICIPQKDFAENVLVPRVPGTVSGWKMPSDQDIEPKPVQFSVTETDKGICELAFNVTQTNRMFCGISKNNITSALVDGSHIAIQHHGAWFLVGIMRSNIPEAGSPNVFLFTKMSRYIMWLIQNSSNGSL